MRKQLTTLLVACFVLATLGGIQVAGEDNPGVPIGEYQRVTGSGDLQEDHVSETLEGLQITGPHFTESLRVNESFIQSYVGTAWAADKSFSLQGGDAVFSGRTVEFFPLEIGADSVFTMGSRDQVEFQGRPMWVSYTQNEPGGTITLDMEDGDIAGQEVFISKDWLWSHGVHRPVVVHEDGSDLPAVPTQQRDGWVIDMHHFSYVEISPAELVVFSRQEGLVVPHTGEVRWYDEDQRLEIDVGEPNDCAAHVTRECNSIDQDILVDVDWLNMRIDDLALHDHPWIVTEYEGDDFYQVNLTAEQTPVTLKYSQFAPGPTPQFTSGSRESISIGVPGFVEVQSSVGLVQINTSYVGGDGLYPSSKVNITWLNDQGITRPLVTNQTGGHPPIIFGGGFMFFGGTGGEEIIDDVETVVGDIIATASETCQEVFEEGIDPLFLGAFQPFEGAEDSSAFAYLAHKTFCWEWRLGESTTLTDPDGWQVWAQVSNVVDEDLGELQSYCTAGSFNDPALWKGVMICEWPEEVDFAGEIAVRFVGAAGKSRDDYYRDEAQGSWDGCIGSVLDEVVSWLFSSEGTPLDCVRAVNDSIRLWTSGDEFIWSTLIYDGLLINLDDFIAISEMSIDIHDPGQIREDTWNFIEDSSYFVAPDSYVGQQSISWSARYVGNPWFKYDPDISYVGGGWTDADWVHLSVVESEDGKSSRLEGSSEISSFDTIYIYTEIKDGEYIVGDALDWEAEPTLCSVKLMVYSEIDGLTYYIGGEIEDPGEETPLCEVLDEAETNEPLFGFNPTNYSIPEGSTLQDNIVITPDDVLNENGSFALAIAKKAIDSAEFIDGITHMGVSDATDIGNCRIAQEPYVAPFKARGGGTRIADGSAISAQTAEDTVICFEIVPLDEPDG